jgi:hypothetical protein
MFVTRNTEYHFRDKTCIAVRDRSTGSWLVSHLALDRRLSAGLRFYSNGAVVPSGKAPEVGEALYFGDDGKELITSRVCGVERPDKQLVSAYPA